MQTVDLIQALLELADEVGLEVRALRASAGEGESPLSSGIVKVKGRIWVVLSGGDPPEAQVGLLASALRAHSGEALDDRYLPPAVRAALDAASEG